MQDYLRFEPLYTLTAAGCISHYTTLAPAIPCTVGLSEREFARSRPPTNGTEQKIDPGRGFARLKEVAKTLGLENRRVSRMYNGPPLLFCTRPRLQLNARYQHLSGEKQSLHGRPRVYAVLARTNGIHS